MTKLKEALEKLLDAAHPAYVSDSHFQKKLIAARDNAFQELESHRLDMQEHIPDVGKTVSLRDQFAMTALQGILSDSGAFYETFGAMAGDCYAIADAMLKEREK